MSEPRYLVLVPEEASCPNCEGAGFVEYDAEGHDAPCRPCAQTGRVDSSGWMIRKAVYYTLSDARGVVTKMRRRQSRYRSGVVPPACVAVVDPDELQIVSPEETADEREGRVERTMLRATAELMRLRPSREPPKPDAALRLAMAAWLNERPWLLRGGRPRSYDEYDEHGKSTPPEFQLAQALADYLGDANLEATECPQCEERVRKRRAATAAAKEKRAAAKEKRALVAAIAVHERGDYLQERSHLEAAIVAADTAFHQQWHESIAADPERQRWYLERIRSHRSFIGPLRLVNLQPRLFVEWKIHGHNHMLPTQILSGDT